MRNSKCEFLTVEEILREASVYEVIASKSAHLDKDIHRKLKSILVDYNPGNVTITKLINVILLRWIQDHQKELNKNFLSKVENRY